MDDVTRFLRTQSLQPVAQGLFGSDFLQGYRIATEHFTLIYRQEGERLLLCDFATAAADGRAVLALRSLVHRIVQAVPALRFVDAMILAAPRDPTLDRSRRRLAELMRAEGAQQICLEDEQWLRYRCH